MKGGEQYATGLAQSTYNQQLQNYLTQNNQIYNMLNGTASLGASASANLGNSQAGVAGGNALVQAAGGQAQATQNAGTAQSAGITGSTASDLGGLNSLGNYGQIYTLNNLLTGAAGGSAFQTDNSGGLVNYSSPAAAQAAAGSQFPGSESPLG
jgi:hypothetical protein